MASIRATFFQECEDQLCELEAGLMAMDEGDSDPETVNAVFRAVHSIKGGAGVFALERLVRFAHVFESALDALRGGRIVTSQSLLATLLRATDALADLVRAARDGGPVDESRIASLSADLSARAGIDGNGPPAPAAAKDAPDDFDGLDFEPVPVTLAPPERCWQIRFKPGAELYAKGNEAGLLLRELGRLGRAEITLDRSDLPDLATLDPEGAYLAWDIELYAGCDEAAIREVFDFVEQECVLSIRAAAALAEPAAPEADAAATPAEADAPPAKPAAGEPAPGATIRVDLERVDRLIDLAGELVIGESILHQLALEAGISGTSPVAMALEELERLTHEIQDGVMAIRAQPVRSVFQRMPRLVRQLAAQTGKQVRLLIDGEATEVDKTVIERLADPLTHMLRNAIDHGLESPQARLAAGKPAEGTVRLHARHRSGRIVIDLEDDGAGIDRARVREKAIASGLISADAQLSHEETDNLIFLPGFSTAETISDISGRGVGMDVVRRSVQSLGGRISINSCPGRGATFTLSLPLTLAVMDGMVVTVAGQTLIIPLGTVLETLQPRSDAIHGLGAGLQLIFIRGAYFPLVDIGAALGFRAVPAAIGACVAVLVENESGTRSVLLVDDLQGQRQVVIKSLEANYRAVPGVAAATVMGDGRVALILDIDAVIRKAQDEPNARAPEAAHQPTVLAEVG